MLTKVFLIDQGHEAVKGYVTYGAGLILDVERDETIDIYAVLRGRAAVTWAGSAMTGSS